MEKRKLILFGSNSFIVSLPKSWIEKNNLSKGDLIQINETDNELIINSSNNNLKKEPQLITIHVDNKEINILRTELVSAYLRGYDDITLTGKEINQKIAKLREIVLKLPGVEIMDLTSTTMRVKNLLNEHSVSIDEIFSRTNNMLLSMIDDTIKCLEIDIHESILERDNDVNRMVFLSFRVLRKAINDKKFAQELGISPEKNLMLWQIFLRLEKIGDYNKRIARIFVQNKIKDKALVKEMLLELRKQYLDLLENYEKNKNDKLLLIATNGKLAIIKKCDLFLEKENDYSTFKVIENLKNMSASIEQIAQILLTVM